MDLTADDGDGAEDRIETNGVSPILYIQVTGR